MGSLIERGYSGKYDQEYLDYLRALLKGMSEYGIVAYIVCRFTVFGFAKLMWFRESIMMCSRDTVAG